MQRKNPEYYESEGAGLMTQLDRALGYFGAEIIGGMVNLFFEKVLFPYMNNLLGYDKNPSVRMTPLTPKNTAVEATSIAEPLATERQLVMNKVRAYLRERLNISLEYMPSAKLVNDQELCLLARSLIKEETASGSITQEIKKTINAQAVLLKVKGKEIVPDEVDHCWHDVIFHWLHVLVKHHPEALASANQMDERFLSHFTREVGAEGDVTRLLKLFAVRRQLWTKKEAYYYVDEDLREAVSRVLKVVQQMPAPSIQSPTAVKQLQAGRV